MRGVDAARAELALAEAFDAGASGAEEGDDGGGVMVRFYVPEASVAGVRAAVAACVPEASLQVAPVIEQDWRETWKEGLAPIDVSPRLRIRTSFETSSPASGQAELVIDPGQAFGTGGHESTALALRATDALYEAGDGPADVLDVGTGTGVLALAARRLGAHHAVGFDLDPLAAPAAMENAATNRIAGVSWFTGSVEALAPAAAFDAILANLLRRELEPLFPGLAGRLKPGGRLVLSGLLDRDAPRVDAWRIDAGLEDQARLSARDESDVEWIALTLAKPPRGPA